MSSVLMEGTHIIRHHIYAINRVYSLIEHYPNFNLRLRASLRMLVGEEVEKRVDIGMAKDGSGVGGMS